MNRTRPHSLSLWLAATLASTLAALVAIAPTALAQTVNKAIEKDSSGNLTASFATGNKTITVASGGTLSAASGSTVTLAGTVAGTPTGGTLNLSGLTLALGTPASGNLTNATSLNATQLTSGTVPAARMPALTGDITTTAGAVATTLATVNANVGTFGSATAAPAVTVNAKGLVTAVSNTTITPAVGSITGLGSGVSTFLVTPSSANLRAALTDESGTGPALFQGGNIGEATGTSLSLSSATASSSTSTGALIVTGGVGVGGNVNAGQVVSASHGSTPTLRVIEAGTPAGSFSSFSGDLYIAIDSAINKDMIFRRQSATEAMRIKGSNGVVSIAATTAATNSTTGALTVAGGVGVAGAVVTGGSVLSGGSVFVEPALANASMIRGKFGGTNGWLIGSGSAVGDGSTDATLGIYAYSGPIKVYPSGTLAATISNTSTAVAGNLTVAGTQNTLALPATASALSTNSTLTFELTSNTSLKILVRGSDGTTRSVSLTLAP